MAALPVVGWAAVVAGFWWTQEAYLFPVPTWATADTLAVVAAERGIDVLDLRAADGTELLGWHHAAGADRAVLFFSGNGEALSDYLPLHELLVASGWDTVTVAWRGYPGSAGAPSQAGLALDARAAWAWAAARFGADRVVVHGRSLGGAVALELVDGHADPPCLVLESTFSRMSDVVRRQVPGLPLGLILRHPFPSVDHARRVTAPTLVLWSTDDALIPPEVGGEALVAALPDGLGVVTHGWAHHDDLPLSDAGARAAWLAFLARCVP